MSVQVTDEMIRAFQEQATNDVLFTLGIEGDAIENVGDPILDDMVRRALTAALSVAPAPDRVPCPRCGGWNAIEITTLEATTTECLDCYWPGEPRKEWIAVAPAPVVGDAKLRALRAYVSKIYPPVGFEKSSYDVGYDLGMNEAKQRVLHQIDAMLKEATDDQ